MHTQGDPSHRALKEWGIFFTTTTGRFHNIFSFHRPSGQTLFHAPRSIPTRNNHHLKILGKVV